MKLSETTTPIMAMKKRKHVTLSLKDFNVLNIYVPLVIQPSMSSDYALSPLGDGLTGFYCTILCYLTKCQREQKQAQIKFKEKTRYRPILSNFPVYI